MKLMVCGYARHGKDTFCEMLGIPFRSSSEEALDLVIWPEWGWKFYESKEECFHDRSDQRGKWFDLIKEYNRHDLTRLARGILERNDIYCGIRNGEEFLKAKEEKIFDLSIWVDASDRLPPEDNSSCTLRRSDCDIVVDNNGSLTDLAAKALAVRNIISQNQRPVDHEIVEWADSVFPERTVTNAISKLVMEEIPEFLMAQDDPLELADIAIIVSDIAHLKGWDLDEIKRRKMAINRARNWEINPITGLMHHTKES